MIRASYRHAVDWIAVNDSAGDDDALDEGAVQYYVTALLVADIFGVEESKVGRDIVKARLAQQRKENQ